MVLRMLTVLLAATFVLGCGSAEEDVKREGYKASTPTPPEATEEAKTIKSKLEEVSKTARQSITKEEIEKPPVSEEFFVVSEAFAASGYRWEALRRKLPDAKAGAGIEYAKLTRYEGRPERADIYDAMGNHLSIVAYDWDNDFKIWRSVYKTAANQMLKMFLYCPVDNDIYVHPLSTFRVHAPYTLKVLSTDNSIIAEHVDGHNELGVLPTWPKCEDVVASQAKGGPYQSPFGLHKQVFNFDESGELLGSASYDMKGGLVEDIRGIAKREYTWEEGRKTAEALYTADELLSRYLFEYDEAGRVTRKKVVDKEGKAVLDYFGVSIYEYTYGKRDRVAKELHKDAVGTLVWTHEYEYGKHQQLALHKIFDGQNTLQTTMVHTFDKKGAREEYAIYDGDQQAGKLKSDVNGVALYRFTYTDKGRLIKESRHGTTQVVDAEGKQDYLLVNALDQWALIVNTYDAEKERDVISTQSVRVDNAGNKVFEEWTNVERRLSYRIERTFEDDLLASAIRTDYSPKGLAVKRTYTGADATVLYVALLTYTSNELFMEESYFAEDGTTAAMAAAGYHKMRREYNEDQTTKSDTYFDDAGNKVKTLMYEYKDDGSFAGTKTYDAEGKEVRQP
jgi:hypothetical protein